MMPQVATANFREFAAVDRLLSGRLACFFCDVRFGSKADIRVPPRDVRFTPKADIAESDWHVHFVPKADMGPKPKRTNMCTKMTPVILGDFAASAIE